MRKMHSKDEGGRLKAKRKASNSSFITHHSSLPLRIAIDAHSVGTGLAGNESYVRSLIEAPAEIDTPNRYTLYVTKDETVERFQNRWPHVSVRLTWPHTPVVRIP